jgi:hypothetical protein
MPDMDDEDDDGLDDQPFGIDDDRDGLDDDYEEDPITQPDDDDE